MLVFRRVTYEESWVLPFPSTVEFNLCVFLLQGPLWIFPFWTVVLGCTQTEWYHFTQSFPTFVRLYIFWVPYFGHLSEERLRNKVEERRKRRERQKSMTLEEQWKKTVAIAERRLMKTSQREMKVELKAMRMEDKRSTTKTLHVGCMGVSKNSGTPNHPF